MLWIWIMLCHTYERVMHKIISRLINVAYANIYEGSWMGFHILFFVKVMIAEPHNAIILFRSVTMLCGVENKLWNILWYFPHSLWMWEYKKIFYEIMWVPHNIVMAQDVMFRNKHERELNVKRASFDESVPSSLQPSSIGIISLSFSFIYYV